MGRELDKGAVCMVLSGAGVGRCGVGSEGVENEKGCGNCG